MASILCFGDSITFGRGEISQRGWVGRLEELLASQNEANVVFNLGVPGNTTEELLARFDLECKLTIDKSAKVCAILIAIGINDARYEYKKHKTHSSKGEFESNCMKLIDHARKYKCPVAFIGPTPVDEAKTSKYDVTTFRNEDILSFNNVLKECCESRAVPFLDLFSILSKGSYRRTLDDGVHPNKKGYDILFSYIASFLKERSII